jgi:L-asparagine oxygenase
VTANDALPTLQLSPTDRQAIRTAAHQMVERGLWQDPERWATEAHVATATLSDLLRRQLMSFRRFGSSGGGLLVRGMPVDALPPTPAVPGELGSARLRPAATLSVVAASLGDQYGFHGELGGQLVQDIVPVQGYESEQISVSSTTALFSHTETAFSEFRCDYLALLCLRTDHERRAGVTLHPVDALLPQLAPQTVAVLSEPRFRTRVDLSFRLSGSGEEEWVEPIRVLSGTADRPRIRFDVAETEGLDDEARRALGELTVAARAATRVVRLAVGDLLIIDNHRALHGRTAFVPRYDGRDRWLLRTFVTRDLASSWPGRADDGRIVTSWRAPSRLR